tara:strand:- start:2755 stop:3378 length:624 start_codon:yes stop_codon:yes gene_type:complete
MNLTYDAPALGNFVTPIRLSIEPKLSFPFRQDLTAIVYEENYVQRADHFVPMALDTPHPEHTNAFLVEESNPSRMNGNLFKWVRKYATIPGNRIEFQTTNFSFPAFKTNSADTSELRASFSETCVAKIYYSYQLTPDPSVDLSFQERFQPVDSSSNACSFVASDTTPTKATYEGFVSASTYIQSQQTAVSRWRGNIWEKQEIKVKAL